MSYSELNNQWSLAVLVAVSLAAPLACSDVDDLAAEGEPVEARANIAGGSIVQLVGAHSGKCVAVDGGRTSDLANIEIDTCSGGDAQAFRVEPGSSGSFALRNVHSGKCIDVFEWSEEPGGNLVQWPCTGGDNQQWIAHDAGEDAVTLESLHSGLFMDVEGRKTANGTHVLQWAETGGSNQQFQVSTVEGSSPPPDDDDSNDDDSNEDDDDTSSVGCSASGLETVRVSSTIRVNDGQIFDGCGRRYISDGLGDGSQDEGQDPIFRVEGGGVLRNVTIGAPAADGVHSYPDGDGDGRVVLENIIWEDIGEDAMTIKSSGTVIVLGGSAFDGSDKVFQVNAASTLLISNFFARNAGKFIRQNGGTTFRVDVTIENSDIREMSEVLFRTDSSTSRVTVRNTNHCDLGDGLFRFGSTNVEPGESHPQASYSNLTECAD